MESIDALKEAAEECRLKSEDVAFSNEQRDKYRQEMVDIYKEINKLEEPKKIHKKDVIGWVLAGAGLFIEPLCRWMYNRSTERIADKSMEFEKTGTVSTTAGKSAFRNLFSGFKK